MRILPALASSLLAVGLSQAGEARPIEVSREFSAADRKDVDAMAALAGRDRVTWNRRTALAWFFASVPEQDVQKVVKTVAACAAQEGGTADVAVALAVNERAGAILALLAKIPATQRLAAETLATRAVMAYCIRVANAGAAAVKARPADGLQNPKLSQPKGLPGAAGDAALVAALLPTKDRGVAERALIAAAYAGGADLIPAADAASAKGEVADACRLLLRARHQQALEPALVASIAAARPRPQIGEALPVLSLGELDVPAQCILLDAIIAAGDAAQVPVVERLLAHPDLRIRVDACRAARRLAAPALVGPLSAMLTDGQWPVLVEACAALGEIGSPDAVEPLIAALKKRSGRLREDLVHALASIAGAQEGRQSAEAWSAWWTGCKASFVPDPAATRAFRAAVRVQDVDLQGYAAFYDMPIRSDRFAFILDASGSMKADGKIDDLRSHATEAVRMLPQQVLFTVVDFGGHITRLGGYEDIGVDRAAALKRIASFELSMGGTRSIDAIAAGLSLRGIDTLYFLSDGDPNGLQCDDWDRSCAMAALLTRHRPVALGMISFHAGAGNAQGMWRMAVEHAGRFQGF
ncbi:MAG: HEAT repeat domain-containing protein [Planctomycetes bacterium]|nr:HEAT repeat domain-containing protein [Planctomycetota bacterium]